MTYLHSSKESPGMNGLRKLGCCDLFTLECLSHTAGGRPVAVPCRTASMEKAERDKEFRVKIKNEY